MTETTIQTKECSNCLEEKEVRLFGKDKSTKDGLNRFCKDCNNKRKQESIARCAVRRLKEDADVREFKEYAQRAYERRKAMSE